MILLDTRTFRDRLVSNDGTGMNDYVPNTSPDSTFLGEAQWAWLEARLREPADLRIIASSNQFAHTYNGWESWTNVPWEQARMLDLIRETKAEGVLFISGDVHWGEISRMRTPALYPIWDVTSSGLTETWPSLMPNDNRVGEAVRDPNFGLIEVDWAAEKIILRIIDARNRVRTQQKLSLNDLRFE